MSDATGLAEAMLRLDGFTVLSVTETDAEVIIEIESTATLVGCASCGVRTSVQDRMRVDCRALAAFGRLARLVWLERWWRCQDPDCEAKTWAETSPEFGERHVLTSSGGADACRQVGQNARPVSQLAMELEVCWWTEMDAVIEHGQPFVDDPTRVGVVSKLGVDETSYLKATRTHPTI